VNTGDREAVADVRRGQRDSFERLVKQYERRLFGLVLMIVRHPAAAEEITQDAFVRAYTHLHLYDDARPFYPWLATIAVRLAHNRLLQQQRRTRSEGGSLHRTPEPGVADTVLAGLMANERDRAIWQTVAALPSGERTAVVLHYRDELSVQATASALGVTTGTVKTLLFRARRHLRERLQHQLLPREEIPT
jgi:RNA polymerase sigma-70 factor (ECF subfamily)